MRHFNKHRIPKRAVRVKTEGCFSFFAFMCLAMLFIVGNLYLQMRGPTERELYLESTKADLQYVLKEWEASLRQKLQDSDAIYPPPSDT